MSRGTWQGSGTWQTSGGGLVLAVIVAAVLLGSGAASAIASALVTILIITGCTIALAVLGGIAWLVYRARQDRPGRPIAARPVYRLPPEARSRLEGSHNPAIGPAREIHLHFHGLPDDGTAGIIRQALTESDTPREPPR